jgi:uncharacterized membrane protein
MKVSINPQTFGLLAAAYIVQFVYLVIGRSVIDNIIVAGYGLIFHPALQNRRELLFRHPLLISVFTGLILGLLPFHAINSGFGALSKPNERWSHGWQKAKLWIAVPFALGFLLSVWSYVASAPANAASVWQSFFAKSCDLDAAHLLVYRAGCANQRIFTATLLCALVYSSTALFGPWSSSSYQEPLSKASGATGEII